MRLLAVVISNKFGSSPKLLGQEENCPTTEAVLLRGLQVKILQE